MKNCLLISAALLLSPSHSAHSADLSARPAAVKGLLYDASGKEIGPFFPNAANGNLAFALTSIGSQTVALYVQPMVMGQPPNNWYNGLAFVPTIEGGQTVVLFAQPGCVGTAYLASTIPTAGPLSATVGDGVGGGAIYIARSMTPQSQVFLSYTEQYGVCLENQGVTFLAFQADAYDLTSLFKAPYNVK